MAARTWDRLRAVFRRERRELEDAVDDATARANEELDRREREMTASPEQRLAMEQERAARQDDEYEALRRRIEGSPD